MVTFVKCVWTRFSVVKWLTVVDGWLKRKLPKWVRDKVVINRNQNSTTYGVCIELLYLHVSVVVTFDFSRECWGGRREIKVYLFSGVLKVAIDTSSIQNEYNRLVPDVVVTTDWKPMDVSDTKSLSIFYLFFLLVLNLLRLIICPNVLTDWILALVYIRYKNMKSGGMLLNSFFVNWTSG